MLRREIQAGELRPGAHLPQDRLAREFSVSQGAVREALGQLASEGLVAIAPRKGAVVRVLTRSEMAELLHLRFLLESDLMKRAIPLITDDGVAGLRRALAEMAHRKHLSDWPRLNWKFHSAIYKYAMAPQTLDLAERIHTTMSRHTWYDSRNAESARISDEEHAQLVELIEGRHTSAAIKLLRKHIRPHIGTWIDIDEPANGSRSNRTRLR